ncbi:MAG TPA: PEP/pyruvate-binding domain-containing protein [Acidimicrobiales bacterium]|jgi:pyruvate,water dikinase
MADQQDPYRPVLVWLDDVRATYPGLVGSKTAALAVLRAHGFAIPDGFAVTAEAYRSAVEAAGIEPALSYPIGLCPNVCAESHFRAGLVAEAEMPAVVVEAIADSYTELGRRLGRPDPTVAVRASAVDEEATFGPTAAALVGVAGAPNVTAAVAACWQALFNERALVTRAALHQQFEPAMAVLVQELVSTVRSGTAYSTDPVRRRPDLVRITATLEDDRHHPPGSVPDVYIVTRRSNELAEISVGQKPSGPSAFRPVLSDDEAQRVAARAVRAEAVLGQPVAMEWALRRDGAVVVLEVHTMSSATSEPDRSMARF